MESKETESDQSRKSVSMDRIADEVLPQDAASTIIKLMEARAAVVFCYIIMCLVGLVLISIIIYLFASMHHLKLSGLTQESLQIYKEGRSMVLEEVVKIGEQLLVKVLLPILTLLLGYIFGSREKR